MKKLLVIVVLISIRIINASGQGNTGVQFEKGSTWQQVLDEAKTQHKFIFVDCYATWCRPCKFMDKNVYPDEKVGEFFNSNFIAVRVQMDTTKSDDEQTKSGYTLAHHFAKACQVGAYPSFLFFDQHGKLTHKGIGYHDAENFIKLGEEAMDSNRQFYPLQEKYRNGQLSDSLIPYLISTAQRIQMEKLADTMETDYLKILFRQNTKSLLQEKNLLLIEAYTKTPQEEGFIFFRAHERQIDSILGKKKSEYMQMMVLDNAIAEPAAKGKTLLPKDWDNLAKSCGSKYGFPGEAAVLQERLTYYWFYNRGQDQRIKDSIQFRNAYIGFYKAHLDTLDFIIDNNLAWDMFNYFNDKGILKMAVNTMEPHKTENPQSMDTYANLLYKTGQKEEALKWERKAVEASHNGKEYVSTLDKMEKGEKTWN